MRRPLRPGLLVTISAGVACAGLGGEEPREPTRNPPPLPRAVTATFPEGPVEVYQVLNPRDEQGRVIRRGPADCYVELPFAEPPTSVMAPPTERVACPAAMMEGEAWSGCLGGTLQVRSVEPPGCVCNFFGNPPPPPSQVVCPREMLERLPPPGGLIPEAG